MPHFQGGGYDVISGRKVLPSVKWTWSVCCRGAAVHASSIFVMTERLWSVMLVTW